jgi:peptidyl-prolyl cis-trans isomerase A (cyclophilin A)
LLLLIGALRTAGDVGAQSPATLTPAQQRAILLNPAHRHWRIRAPDTAIVDMETSRGNLTIELIREWAPYGVDRFYNLARAGYFDDVRFYRVLPFFVAQFGLGSTPAVDRTWRTRSIPADSVRTTNARGTLTFAQRTPRDRNVDVFINLRDNGPLDTLGFAPIGRVVRGMEAADSLHSGYGELPSMPAPLGNPRRFYGEANRYLDQAFPKLDRIVRARLRQTADSSRSMPSSTR